MKEVRPLSISLVLAELLYTYLPDEAPTTFTMKKSTTLLLYILTGIGSLLLFTDCVEGRSRLPDLLLRQFINLPQEKVPDSPSSQEDVDEDVSMGDVNMTEIREILRHKYGLGDMMTREGSSLFILELYRKLQGGESLLRASGHRGVDLGILQSDTVRSFRPKGTEQTDTRVCQD